MVNTKCPITETKNKINIIDLGNIPLVNNLCSTKEESINSNKYKLSVSYYEDSNLCMLDNIVDSDLLFHNYLYKSGVSQPYIDHCKELFWFNDNYLFLNEKDFVLDIGGNDGTLLKTFLEKKSYLNVLNVDASSNITAISNENGIPSINGYWNLEFAEKNLFKNKFKLITSTNVFQHTLDIISFVRGIKYSLIKNGIWCLEFPYWIDNMNTNQYDQIYHEHIYYYNITPLKLLFEKYDLEIIKAVKYPIHGGTMRLLISHKGNWIPCPGVDLLLKEEKKYDLEYYKKWSDKIKLHIKNCKEELLSLQNKNIACFGAAAKGCVFLNTLFNYEEINQLFKYVIDDTNLKIDKYMPGIGLKIVSRNVLKIDNIDYILILAHNFSDYIINSLKEYGYKGKFIICFPEFKIIN